MAAQDADDVGGTGYSRGISRRDHVVVLRIQYPLLQSPPDHVDHHLPRALRRRTEGRDDPPDHRQLAGDLLRMGHGVDRLFRAVAGELPGRLSGAGDGQDRRRLDVLHQVHRRFVDDIHLVVVGKLMDPEIGIDRLRLPDRGTHGLHRLHRILADGALLREHQAVGTVQNRVGHIADLRPGRPLRMGHAQQHLSGGDHRLGGFVGFADQHLLDLRDPVVGDLDPQISPSHHQPVAHFQNLVDIFYGIELFDLGDKILLPAQGLYQPPGPDHIRSLLDEGDRHEIHAVLHPPGDILSVLVGQDIQVQPGIGEVDPFAGGEHSAADHLRLHTPADPDHPGTDDPVVEVDQLSHFELVQ